MHKFRKLLALIICMVLVLSITGISNAKVRRTVPATPTGISAVALSSSEISISWNSVSGASGYKLYAAAYNNSSFTLLATISGTSYRHVNLKAASTYWYYVVAYNNIGSSNESAHISATTQLAASPSPTSTPTPTPSPTPSPTPVAASGKYFLGFATYYYSGDSSSYNSMTTNATSIDQIATATYTTDGAGNITGLVPTQQIAYANSNGIQTTAMIANNFDGNIARTLLESATNRQALINNALQAVKANNYKGINIDIEGIFAADRNNFTQFMSEVYAQFKPLGLEVSVCVPAKTADNPAHTWNYAYDYASLAKYADRFIVMAYDEHYPGGQPGPVASIGWVQNVANYTISVVPKEKILLGIAAYGYDWSSNGTKAYSINGIYNLAAANNAVILWDEASKSYHFSYVDVNGISHTAWFEDARSTGYKLDIINNLGLSGAALWRLGLENADYWTTLKAKLGL